MSAIETISIDQLVVPEDNVRSEVGDVSELAASIKSVGVLEPLIVREDDLLVVAGSRRLAGAKEAGLKEVPVIKRKFTEEERIAVMVIENLQREDLTPLDEARGFQRLVELKLSQRAIAARVGCSQAHVSKRLALVALPEVAQAAVDSGGITLEEAGELAKLKAQPQLVEQIVEKRTKAVEEHGGHGPSVTRLVAMEAEKKDREKALKAKKRELEKAGETIVVAETDNYGYGARLPKGVARVQLNAYDPREVPMDPAKHKRFKCSATGLNAHSLETFEVCTDPGKHPTVEDVRNDKRDAAQAEAQKAADEWAKMTERRQKFVASIVRGKLTTSLVLDAVMLAFAKGVAYWGGGDDDYTIACELAGVAYDSNDALEVHAAKSLVEKERVVFAMACGQLEDGLLNRAQPWNGDATTYYAMLVGLGYSPTKLEKELLDAAAEAEAERLALEEEDAAEALDDEVEDGTPEEDDEAAEPAAEPDPEGQAEETEEAA